ncbi:hypothetical protein Q7P37_010181 [Cladosporium fusiforme]
MHASVDGIYQGAWLHNAGRVDQVQARLNHGAPRLAATGLAGSGGQQKHRSPRRPALPTPRRRPITACGSVGWWWWVRSKMAQRLDGGWLALMARTRCWSHARSAVRTTP